MDIVTTHLCRRLNLSLVSFTTPFAISSEQESLNNTQIRLQHQKLLQEDERQYDTDYVNLCQPRVRISTGRITAYIDHELRCQAYRNGKKSFVMSVHCCI